MPVQFPAQTQEEEPIKNRRENALDVETFSTDQKIKTRHIANDEKSKSNEIERNHTCRVSNKKVSSQ